MPTGPFGSMPAQQHRQDAGACAKARRSSHYCQRHALDAEGQGRPPPQPQRSSSRRAQCAPCARCRRAKCRHQGKYSSTCAMCANDPCQARNRRPHEPSVNARVAHGRNPGKSWIILEIRRGPGEPRHVAHVRDSLFWRLKSRKWPPDVSLRAPSVEAHFRPTHLWAAAARMLKI